MLPTSYTEKKSKPEELTLENMMRIQPNPIMKQRPVDTIPSRGTGLRGRNEREQEHHATLPTGRTALPGLGQLDRSVCGAGQVGEAVVRTPLPWEPLTLPCISSRMVRVTLRPPSDTLDSISYQGTGDVRQLGEQPWHRQHLGWITWGHSREGLLSKQASRGGTDPREQPKNNSGPGHQMSSLAQGQWLQWGFKRPTAPI